MARTPQSGSKVQNLFFTSERYERALHETQSRLRRRALADYSCLPDLVEIGGYHYESGQKLFEQWSASLKALLGDTVQPLLNDAWELIPRASAEHFAQLMQGVLSDQQRMRIEQAYRRLTSPVVPAPQAPDYASPQQSAVREVGSDVHEHICSRCGLEFRHDPGQCEPPYDALCNLCAEQEMGPMPIYAQRWVDRPDITAEQLIACARAGTVESRSESKRAGGFPPAGQASAATEERNKTEPAGKAADAIATPAERGLAKVAGMDDLKALLQDEVVSALREPEDLQAYGLTIPNGILLFGPPGCGKTYISRQLAEELNFFFKEVFPSEIGSTFIHDTTLKIRDVFDSAADNAPAMVFIDEFEAMVPARRSLAAHQQHTAEEVSEFLKQLESCAQRHIMLIAATNEPWKIDPAVIRTGRLDKLIYVAAPDAGARTAMLRFHLWGRRQEDNIDVAAIAEVLSGYAASDIKLLVDEAARRARKERRPITEEDLRIAVRDLVHASITARDELRFLAFAQRGVKSSHYKVANDIASALRTVQATTITRKIEIVQS